MKHRTIALAISVALGATLASAVRAQAVQAGDAAGPTLLDEVTVTARKREEALQDIPLVVNAFTAEQIERSNIQGLADISLRTPGLKDVPQCDAELRRLADRLWGAPGVRPVGQGRVVAGEPLRFVVDPAAHHTHPDCHGVTHFLPRECSSVVIAVPRRHLAPGIGRDQAPG